MELDDRYLAWLVSHVSDGGFMHDGHSYEMVCRVLFSSEFYIQPWCPMDKNRVGDGEELRYLYGDETHMDVQCTILEMMIALSIRVENEIMSALDGVDRTALWFWDMMDNSGLSMYDDMNFDEDAVNDICCDIVERTYSPDGTGGLFGYLSDNIDITRVDIWDQLSWYIGIHYN